MHKTVIWSENAKNELNSIISYWNKRNNSSQYTNKILFHIDLAINLIKHNPKLGVKSNKENVRLRLILKNYYIVYQFDDLQIRILRFWDVRQNPLKLKNVT